MTDNPNIGHVFEDYKIRRAAMIRALTKEADKFYQLCDPRKENLCLYGLSTGKWEVHEPAEEVPPELPEPALGINYARDAMDRKEWLCLVAVHSDCWLLAIAFYFAVRNRFQKDDRDKLFQLMSDLPTIYDVVNMEVKTTKVRSHRTKSRKTRPQKSEPPKAVKRPREEDKREAEGGDEEGALCAACGIDYADEEFWIACDICEKWYHGKCVSVTPTEALNIKDYECPTCSKKK